MSVSEREVDEYLRTAIWSSSDESDETGGEPLDTNYSVDDFTKKARAQARAELEAFWKQASFVIEALERDGHEVEWGDWPHLFWLTRNGHGVGFWAEEKAYGEAARPLTEIAHRFGEQHVVVSRSRLIFL